MFVIIFLIIAVIGLYGRDWETFAIGILPILGGIFAGMFAIQDDMPQSEVRKSMQRWEKYKREQHKRK